MPTRCFVLPIFLCAAVSASLPTGATAGAPAPGAAAEQAAEAVGANGEPRIESVGELLAALEKSDEGLLALSADIQHDKKFKLQDDEQVRRGKLAFVSVAANAPGGRPKRSFAIAFEDLIVGDAMSKDPQIWIFDGQWLIEKRPKQKQFIKRRIAPPNADFDPLRIGEGTLPIPIGQKAADILKRYDAELHDALDGVAPESKMAAFVDGTKQLRLVPKAERAEEDEFTELRLWYRWDEKSGRFLPRLARTTGRSGDESDIQLIRVAVRVAGRAGDANIPAGAFDTTPPTEEAGWDVQVIDDVKVGSGEKEVGSR